MVHIQCRRTDLHRRQPISLHWVGCLAQNNAQRTMWEHQIIKLEIHRAKKLNSGNPWINFILHQQGIVTLLCSHHFQVLPSSTTLPDSTWNQALNHALVVQPKDIIVMRHRGKDTTCPKKDIVDPKSSPLSNSQGRGRHRQAHLKCLQHWLETFQSIGRHLPPLLNTGKFPAHHRDLTLASEENNSSRLRNSARQMLQR